MLHKYKCTIYNNILYFSHVMLFISRTTAMWTSAIRSRGLGVSWCPGSGRKSSSTSISPSLTTGWSKWRWKLALQDFENRIAALLICLQFLCTDGCVNDQSAGENLRYRTLKTELFTLVFFLQFSCTDSCAH